MQKHISELCLQHLQFYEEIIIQYQWKWWKHVARMENRLPLLAFQYPTYCSDLGRPKQRRKGQEHHQVPEEQAVMDLKVNSPWWWWWWWWWWWLRNPVLHYFQPDSRDHMVSDWTPEGVRGWKLGDNSHLLQIWRSINRQNLLESRLYASMAYGLKLAQKHLKHYLYWFHTAFEIVYDMISLAWLCMVLKLGRFGSRSEIPGKFWNVVLEKDGEDQLDGSREIWRSVTYSQWAEEYPTWNKEMEG